MSAPFRLSFCGRFLVTNDLRPYLYSLDEARDWQARAERDGARYEAEADSFDRQGRTFDADIARLQASISINLAADLAEVLAGAQHRDAA